MTRIITIAGGEKGVGKTAIAINLAAQLARQGRRVCLLDAAWGQTGLTAVLGLSPQHTLRELLLGEALLEQVLVQDCHGFDVVPGCPGQDWEASLSTAQVLCLADVLHELGGYDIVLIDSASAMPRQVQALLLASPETLMVITPGANSLTQAYTLLKALSSGRYDGHIHLFINLVDNQDDGEQTYGKFREVAEFYLGAQLPLTGMLGSEPELAQGQQPLVSKNPDCVAAHAMQQLAECLLQEQAGDYEVAMQDFVARYLRASGVEAAEAPAAMDRQAVVVEDDVTLHQQIDGLSSRVEQLIAEIDRLRGDEDRHADLYMLPRTGKRATPERCNEVCVAMDTHAEEVTVQGETFSIYHMPRSNGDPQRFACHSLDDDQQQPRPQSTSS